MGGVVLVDEPQGHHPIADQLTRPERDGVQDLVESGPV
jgi:hypothetical protein